MGAQCNDQSLVSSHKGGRMARYRCILIGAPGHIETFELECKADAEAIVAGRHMLADHADHHAFELWRDTRRVHVELRETAG